MTPGREFDLILRLCLACRLAQSRLDGCFAVSILLACQGRTVFITLQVDQMNWLSSLFKRGKPELEAKTSGAQTNAQTTCEKDAPENAKPEMSASLQKLSDNIAIKNREPENAVQTEANRSQNGVFANISDKVNGIAGKFKNRIVEAARSTSNNTARITEKLIGKLVRNRKAPQQTESQVSDNQQETDSTPPVCPVQEQVDPVNLKKEVSINDESNAALGNKGKFDECVAKLKGFLKKFPRSIWRKANKCGNAIGSLAKKSQKQLSGIVASAEKILPLSSSKKRCGEGDSGLDFKRAVKINISKAVIYAVLRWIYFIGVIAAFHKLAVTYGENTHMAVACAIVFFIYPYYVYIFSKFLYWYSGVLREEKYMIIQPFELAYIYVCNQVKSTLESRWPWMPFCGWVSEFYLEMKSKDIWLWVNVGVLLGMYALGWLLYINFYKEIMLYSTGIHFNHFWQPFIWPFTVLFG